MEISKRQQEINEAAESYARMRTSDRDMQPAFADAYSAGARWADGHQHWVSVEEGLPDGCVDCLLYTEPIDEDASYEGRYRRGYFDMDDAQWHIGGEKWGNTRVTHWLPLPEPPQKENYADNEWHYVGGEIAVRT